jgi:hypothetical protein
MMHLGMTECASIKLKEGTPNGEHLKKESEVRERKLRSPKEPAGNNRRAVEQARDDEDGPSYECGPSRRHERTERSRT